MNVGEQQKLPLCRLQQKDRCRITKYAATFPLLLNISGEPTYFIALKDDAGLVKNMPW